MPDDPNTPFTDQQVGPNNVLQAEAMRQILRAGLFAGATGIGIRTAQGIKDYLGRNLGAPPRVPLRQSLLSVPVPVGPPPAPRRPRIKRGDAAPPAGGAAPVSFSEHPLTWAAQHATGALGLLRGRGQGQDTAVGDAFSGWSSPSPLDKPWVYPVGAAAIGGGLYGGYKLTDWLLDKARRRESEGELARARREYEEAMLGQYGQKTAGVDPVDALFEKSAGVIGPALGLGLLGMGTVGLASGLGSYHWARSRSKTKALEEAIKRRQEALFGQAPRPIMAVPVAHSLGQAPMPGEEPEEDEIALGKVASIAQAADRVLQRFQAQRQRAQQHWQMLINGPPKDSGKAETQEPQPPQLPSLAGAYTRLGAQPPSSG
jgi:hypothetical protein